MLVCNLVLGIWCLSYPSSLIPHSSSLVFVPIVLIENFRAIFYAPFYAACSTGAYAAEGLEVELKVAAELGKALQAVTAGAGQVSWGGPLRILAALDRDPKC